MRLIGLVTIPSSPKLIETAASNFIAISIYMKIKLSIIRIIEECRRRPSQCSV